MQSIFDGMLDITAPENISIEVQNRPQFEKDTRVLYVHAEGRTVLRVCRIPDEASLHIVNANQKPFLIKFWHGTPSKESLFYKKVMSVVKSNDKDTNLFFDGDMNQWVEKWNSHFVYYPAVDHEKEHISGTIFVTQYSNYGGRG